MARIDWGDVSLLQYEGSTFLFICLSLLCIAKRLTKADDADVVPGGIKLR
jgi:hypothetical protein